MAKLLVVDDEQSICWGLKQLGESLGHQVFTASSAEQALEILAANAPDCIVLDVRLPGMDGLAAIGKFRQILGAVPIIVITAYGDLNTAVRAVRGGAFEYLLKPFDLEQVQRALQRALDSRRAAEVRRSDAEPDGDLVGGSPQMQEVFKRIALAAASDACVLLCGESGTGKELAARAIHRYSLRANRPFVAVNIASLSPSLAESELFGHVRGAFTGADQSRAGLLVRADGGTLFLDEVADIPLPAQVKLLRALEHGEVLPVGSTEPVKTDFRIVSATHRSLLECVQQGTFRHDLYFRLCTFQIDIPPLRERPDDLRELAEHFLYHQRSATDAPRPTISHEALAELARRPWYGNVRELRNAVEHAVIVARGGTIAPEHLPPPLVRSQLFAAEPQDDPARQIHGLIGRWAQSQLDDPNSDRDHTLYERLLELVEPPLFELALRQHKGQYAAAARSLGLHRTTLKKKLDQYGIDNR